jgi:hypothetical protein
MSFSKAFVWLAAIALICFVALVALQLGEVLFYRAAPTVWAQTP